MIWCLGIFAGGLLLAGSCATKRTRKIVWPAFWAPKGSDRRRRGWDDEPPLMRAGVYQILVGLVMAAVVVVVGIIWVLVGLISG